MNIFLSVLVCCLIAPLQDDRKSPTVEVVDLKSLDIVGVDAAIVQALRKVMPTPTDWAVSCKVVVNGGSDSDREGRPAVAGTWTVTDEAIRFEPQFPLVPGLSYRLTCQLKILVPNGGEPFTRTVLVPKAKPGPRVQVTQVYPSGNILPENTLRLYIHFSGVMSRGNIYRHVKLLRESGSEVTSPFLELEEELWSTDGLRITFLFHPGRVKHELVPRDELGPILESGKRYTLVIDSKWNDAEGRPMAAEFRKTIIAGPANEEAIDPSDWKICFPRARTHQPINIRLAKPLDRALLEALVSVVDKDGNRVPGIVTVGGGERVVTFEPVNPWLAGSYQLIVDRRLEDTCGNRVGEPFEVDLGKGPSGAISDKPFARPFVVK